MNLDLPYIPNPDYIHLLSQQTNRIHSPCQYCDNLFATISRPILGKIGSLS